MALTDGLIAAWRMEEASGSLTSVFTGNNTVPAAGLSYQQAGKINNAVGFDGVSSFAQAAHAATTDLGIPLGESRTVSAWVKPASGGLSNQFILGKRLQSGDGQKRWDFLCYDFPDASKVSFQADFGDNFDGGLTTQATTPAGFAKDAFHLVFVTYERTVTGYNLYVDNVLQATADASLDGAIVDTLAPFTFGKLDFAGGYFFKGLLDEVMVWNRVLSTAERNQIWNGGAGANIFAGNPPSVSTIVPNTGINTGVVSVTITGTDFLAGATAKLKKAAQPDISATGLVVVDGNTITCNFDLTGVATGAWDVEITTSEGTGTLAGAFTVVVQPAPTVLSISPASGPFTGPVSVTITGTDFIAGATARLTKTGEIPIDATALVVVNGTTITCDFNITGAANGPWNVEVTTSGGTGALAGGFTVGGLASPTSVTPAFGSNKTSVPLVVQIGGNGFVVGNAVKLTAPGFPDIVASPVVVNSSISITATFDLAGKQAGPYTLSVV